MITRISSGSYEYCGGSDFNLTNSSTVGYQVPTTIKFAYSIVAPVLLVTGILGNTLNLIVLTRPFLKGGTQIFLTALAVSDLSVMLTAIPMVIRWNQAQGSSYTAAFFHAHIEIFLSNIFIGSSVFIVVCLTIERYFSVCLPTSFQNVHTKKNARKLVICCYVTSMCISLPLIGLKSVCHNTLDTCSDYDIKENITVTSTLYWNIYLYCSESVLRFGPCVILATLNILIIKKFRKIAAKRRLLRTALADGKTDDLFPYNKDANFRKTLRNKRYQEEKRLIGLLHAIVVLFFVTMTPSAILSLLYSDTYHNALWFQIFRALANNLELANFALNFYVYCLCSKEFRIALVKIFTGCIWTEDEQSDIENGNLENTSKIMKSIKFSDYESGTAKL